MRNGPMDTETATLLQPAGMHARLVKQVVGELGLLYDGPQHGLRVRDLSCGGHLPNVRQPLEGGVARSKVASTPALRMRKDGRGYVS